MKNKTLYLTTALISSVAFANYAIAADAVLAEPVFEERFDGKKPAVSGINGKISIDYTYLNFDVVQQITGDHLNLYGGDFSISAPLGQSFGVQLDGGVARIDAFGGNLTVFGGGLHLFYRDPDRFLAGFYGDLTRIDGLDATLWRAGVEGEAYLDRFSLEAFAGVQGVTGSGFSSDTIFTGDLTAAFYPTDDLRLDASVIRNFDVTYGRVGIEYQADIGSVQPTLYANATFGDGFQAYKAGLRFYFGQDGNKSLIRRHREDDPRARSTDVLFGLGEVLEEAACKSLGDGFGDDFGGEKDLNLNAKSTSSGRVIYNPCFRKR